MINVISGDHVIMFASQSKITKQETFDFTKILQFRTQNEAFKIY